MEGLDKVAHGTLLTISGSVRKWNKVSAEGAFQLSQKR